MKSEPFWMVMGAPAALSTNMEVYCPAWVGGGGDGTAVRKEDGGRRGPDARDPPVAPAAPEPPP